MDCPPALPQVTSAGHGRAHTGRMSDATPSILASIEADLAKLREHLGAPSSTPSVALRLDEWLSECGHLSERTKQTYREAVTFAALTIDLTGPTVSKSAIVECMMEMPPGRRNALGGALCTGLHALGLEHAIPSGRVWRYKPDANRFAPDGYHRAVSVLVDGLDKALWRSRRSRTASHCPAYLSVALCGLALGLTGVRSGEAVTMSRKNLRYTEHGYRLMVAGKVGQRWIPVPEQVARLLHLCPDGDWAFPARKGSSLPHIGVTSLDHYYRRLRLALDEDCEALKPLAIRHAYASWLVEQRTPITVVQALMGHSDPATTLKFYARPSAAVQHGCAQVLADALAPQLELPGMVPGLSLVGGARPTSRGGGRAGAARGPRGDARGTLRAGSSGDARKRGVA